MRTKGKQLGLNVLSIFLLSLMAVLALVSGLNAMVSSNEANVAGPVTDKGQSGDVQALIDATNANVTLNRATGKAQFARFSSSVELGVSQGATIEAKALAFFDQYGAAFGIQNAASEMVLADTRTDNYGTTRLTYVQSYKDFPVFGSEMHILFDKSGSISAINGVFVPNIDVNPTASIERTSAESRAVAEVVASTDNLSVDLNAVHTDRMIFRTGLVQGIAGESYLAYRVEVADAAATVREFVFIDAHNGKVLDQITGVHNDLDRRIYLESLSDSALVWTEGDATPYVGDEESGINNLINFAEDAYNFYINISGGAYDSYDGSGATMHSVFNDPRINCPNANWNGVSTNYCSGVDGADTVIHEWTHAYTQFTHGLIYQWQPGALNESYSDMFGEAAERINGESFEPNGPRTAGQCSEFTRNSVANLNVDSPASIAGDYDASLASFGPLLTTPMTGTLMLADDGSAAPTEACHPLTNDLTGKVALIRRGTCAFVTKVTNAQNAGAIGVMVANNDDEDDDAHFPMGGDGTFVTIPSIMIGFSDGNTIEAELANDVSITATTVSAGPTDNSYRWLSGEADTAFGGAIRDLWNPSCYGDPAKVIDTNYACGTGDAGGVHTNSGVPNHAFALLVDGGTYNGVDVTQVGMTKTVAIYWRAMSVYQTKVTDFVNHADSVEASCADLTGADIYDPLTGAVSSAVITADDCTQIANAMAAVEMRTDPTAQCSFEPMLEDPPPAVCAGMGSAVDIYHTDFATADDWSVSTDIAYPAVDPLTWELTSTIPTTYTAQSGMTFYAIDESDGSCSGDPADTEEDSRVLHLDSPDIVVPGGATHPRVSFWHYMASELAWDGGNVKVSVNDGDWQVVEGRFYTFNAYNGVLNNAAAGNSNPIGGEEGFTGTDGGHVTGTWGQSQVNVGRYAKPGDTVKIRFDFGNDGCGGIDGWYVDNVEVYYCDGQVDTDITVYADGVEDHLNGFGLASTLAKGESSHSTLDIVNSGIGELDWSIFQQALSSLGNLVPEQALQADVPSGFDGNQSIAPTANFVQDASFESGADFDYLGGQDPNLNWNSYGAPVICENAICGANALDGTNYLWPGVFAGSYSAGVTQTVAIANTGLAFLTMEVWVPSPVATDMLTVTIDGNSVFSLSGADAGDYTSFYTTVTIDVSAYADGGEHVLDISASVDGDAGPGYLIDLVDITDSPTCLTASNIPWLGLTQSEGTVARDQTDSVSVFFDATGLAPGVYEANLCVTSTAPDKPLVAVPVTLQVLYETYLPSIFK